MDALRWILLAVGVLVIAGLFGYYKWQESGAKRPGRKSPRSRGRGREDRDVEAALQDMDDFVLGDDDDAEARSGEDAGVAPSGSADEGVGRARTAGNPRALDDADDTVGPVRVRQVGDPEASPASRAAPERRPPPEPEPEFEPEFDAEPPDAGDLRAEREDTRTAARDDDASWNLGPVRIPRPSWTREGERSGGREETRDDAGETSEREAVAAAVGEKIIVLHVHAGEGLCFTAPAVQEALEALGLRFGQHGIFHRHVETSRGHEPMFSVASMVKPGTLDPNDPDTMETPGLALFMQLPGPFDGLSGFEQMLEGARRLADRLEGHLLDGNRCDLTNQAVEHIREDLREYRRLAHLAARRHRA